MCTYQWVIWNCGCLVPGEAQLVEIYNRRRRGEYCYRSIRGHPHVLPYNSPLHQQGTKEMLGLVFGIQACHI